MPNRNYELLTCLCEEIDVKRKLTEEETILETIKLIAKLEAEVCKKQKTQSASYPIIDILCYVATMCTNKMNVATIKLS